jgi:two-component system, NarL family, response regulator DevR
MPHSNRVIRVLLVDDLDLVRTSVRATLENAGIEVVAEAGTIAEAVVAAGHSHPDVVLLDVRLPDGSGVDACRGIRAACPHTRILFLSAYEDEAAIFATVFAVADGYVLKEIGGDHLAQAIRTVASGLSVINPKARRPMLKRLRWLPSGQQGPAQLSPQEQRALGLIAQGRTNKEIAAAMGLSSSTVKNYLSRLFRKLKVTRRSEAVARSLCADTTGPSGAAAIGPIDPKPPD